MTDTSGARRGVLDHLDAAVGRLFGGLGLDGGKGEDLDPLESGLDVGAQYSAPTPSPSGTNAASSTPLG